MEVLIHFLAAYRNRQRKQEKWMEKELFLFHQNQEQTFPS